MAELSADEVFGTVNVLERLYDELDEKFPHYHPTPTDDMNRIMYRAGQRHVVNFIKSKLGD